MNLVTIESLEEQKNIMEQLKKYETEPAVYWISLDRKDKKSGWRWKYPGKFLKLWFGVNRQTGWRYPDGDFQSIRTWTLWIWTWIMEFKNFKKSQSEKKQKTSSVSLIRILQPFGIGYVELWNWATSMLVTNIEDGFCWQQFWDVYDRLEVFVTDS